MRRNIEGLKRSARLRSENAMQRALAALQRMETCNREINFRSVAAEAQVSTSWLYGEPELRSRIARLRRPQSSRRSAVSVRRPRASFATKHGGNASTADQDS